MHTDLPPSPLTRGGPMTGLTESIPGISLSAGGRSGNTTPSGVVIDRLGLTWVQPAMDEVWGQVRSSLEAFAQDPTNFALLRPVLEQVHHLAGLFDLMELPAARLTLLEAGRLLGALQHGQGELDAAAAESIPGTQPSGVAMRPKAMPEGVVESLLGAVSRVALYVELLRRGQVVPELALLPACNGLRLAQGLPALGARAFLERIALMQAGALRGHGCTLESARRVAAESHALLQRALLAWLKTQPQAHLAVAKAFATAAGGASTREEGMLWWIAELLGRALGDPRLAQADGLKPLLGRLNRELKRRTEAEFEPTPQTALGANELAHEILILLVQHVSQHPAVVQALAALGWPSQIPGARESEAAEQALLVAEPTVLAQAAEQLKAAFDPVQDRFDLAMRSGDVQAILGLAPELYQLAATMRMLELEAAARALEVEASRLRDAQAQGVTLDDDGLEQVACTLMRADVEIERLRLGLPEGEGISATMLVEATNAAAVQGLEDVLLAKELLLTMWKEGGDDKDRRGEVRQLLERVRGSFEMLSLHPWSGLVGGVLDYTAALPPDCIPPQREQDAVADVFASLEYGLENLRDYRQVPERVLVFGAEALARLRDKDEAAPAARAPKAMVEPVMAATTPSGAPGLHLAKASAMEGREAQEERVSAAGHTASPEGQTPSLDSAEASPPLAMDMKASAPVAGEPVAAAMAVPVPRLVPEDTDNEVLEIFIEEAREVLETIRMRLAQWRDNPADRSALTELRRAFHTLKGSGRIIGAQLIGEFGWAFENLLNRVLEGVLSPSDALFRLLEQAPGRLGQLLDALEGKPGLVVAEVKRLCEVGALFLSEGPAALDRLAGEPKPAIASEPIKAASTQTAATPTLELVTKSEPVGPIAPPAWSAATEAAGAVPEHAPVAKAAAHPEAVTPPPARPMPRIDAQLYEIFRSEVEEYLQVLRQAAERGRHEGGLHPDAELIRVTHSLLGSARTAGVPRIVALAERLEHAMRLAWETQQVFDTGLLELIDAVVDGIELLLNDLGGLKVELPDLDRLVQELGDAVVRLQSPQKSREAV
ncbi:MAG: Hpt domain-containing protein, partial [Halothiobacillaceae bacterium]